GHETFFAVTRAIPPGGRGVGPFTVLGGFGGPAERAVSGGGASASRPRRRSRRTRPATALRRSAGSSGSWLLLRDRSLRTAEAGGPTAPRRSRRASRPGGRGRSGSWDGHRRVGRTAGARLDRCSTPGRYPDA